MRSGCLHCAPGQDERGKAVRVKDIDVKVRKVEEARMSITTREHDELPVLVLLVAIGKSEASSITCGPFSEEDDGSMGCFP